MFEDPDQCVLLACLGLLSSTHRCNRGAADHTGAVYCVEYARDGQRFASGGADNTVMVWDSKHTCLMKYSHKDSIQALAYNPVTHQLASCTARDFALWVQRKRNVRKKPVPSKVLCASWSLDGQALALGMLNGTISIRDPEGAETMRIARDKPVWSLSYSMQWNALEKQDEDLLAVGCWDQTLSFYSGGQQVGRDVALGYDPTCVSWFTAGQFLLVSGSNKKTTLFTKDGIELCTAAEGEDWAWAAKQRPRQNYVAVARNDGTVSMHMLAFTTVHGLYKDRYAYRDSMTDVIVQHLLTDHKVRIRCKDYVKKIAVYKSRLAVQLKKRVLVYELGQGDDAHGMQYRVKKRINEALECNLLVVTAEHVILCQESRLQLFALTGHKEREWVLESVIRYIKVTGGPDGGEGLLVGLKNGAVFKIFVNNPFPILVTRHTRAVRCLDVSLDRTKMALVDDANTLQVMDMESKEVLFQHDGTTSVAWNSQAEDVLCFSGNEHLHIKTGTFPLVSQPLQGFVVGFHGSKVFCLQSIAMQTVDVPQGVSMHRYIDTRKLDDAYAVACLGVTDSDWRALGVAALKSVRFDIARKAFSRIKDMRYMELLTQVEAVQASRRLAAAGSDVDPDAGLLADVLAFEGRFEEAASMYKRGGMLDAAIDMYTDLRRWEAAKQLAESSAGAVDVRELLVRQAQVAEDSADFQAAASIFTSLGQHERAINLLGENGDLEAVAALVRTLDASNRGALDAAAKHFRAAGKEGARHAKETYIKMGDIVSLLGVHVECEEWDEAISLATSADAKAAKEAEAAGLPPPSSEHTIRVYLPYAEWLVNRGEYVKAREALSKANRPDLAATVLVALSVNAVTESRHKDACVQFLQLAGEELNIQSMTGQGAASEEAPLNPRRSLALVYLARVHYAYSFVLQFVDAPFTPLQPHTIFQAAAFVLNGLTAASNPSIPHEQLEYLDSTVFFPSYLPSTAAAEAGQRLSGPRRNRAPLVRADGVPIGVEVAKVLYAVAQQAAGLGAYRLAKSSYDRLSALHYPPSWRDSVEMARLALQAKPFTDKDSVLPMCYRCSTVNSVLRTSGSGDVCSNCGHPFVRCMVTFDHLPLVQFVPDYDGGLTDEAALSLIKTDTRRTAASGSGTKTISEGGVQALTFSTPAGGTKSPDADSDQLQAALEASEVLDFGSVLKADEGMLRSANRTRIIVAPWNTVHPELHIRFFFNMMPDVHVACCNSCCSLFNAQQLEQQLLKTGNKCPVCSASADFIQWGNL